MTKQELASLRVRRIVTKDVGLAGVMLYVPLAVQECGEWPAWTDGLKMYFGPAFFEYAEDEQLGVCLHESLHVVFRHVQRGISLYEREGSAYRHDLWNAACDAVINNSIAQIPWARLPKDFIQMEKLLGRDALQAKPPHLWTSEQIYEELKKRGQSIVLEPFEFINDLNPAPRSQRSTFSTTASLSAPQISGSEPHDREMETRLWRERIVRAQAGSLSGGVLRKLANEVPRPQIRWEVALREFLRARCMPTTEISWNRPSRRTLSQGQEATLVEAGLDRKRGLTRIGVVVDTSGSISDDVIARFIGEINGIMKATSAETVVIDCDAAVHSVTVFRQPLRAYRPKGGGGTDFRPGVAELERERVTVGVYLTDLCGTFPERKPKFPLLWAVTQDLDIPFGRKVLIPNK